MKKKDFFIAAAFLLLFFLVRGELRRQGRLHGRQRRPALEVAGRAEEEEGLPHRGRQQGQGVRQEQRSGHLHQAKMSLLHAVYVSDRERQKTISFAIVPVL